MATFLREIYEVLGCFSTATHTAMCNDLLRQLVNGERKNGNLARYFADALKANTTTFSQVDQPFIPLTRKGKKGTNPVAEAMKTSTPLTIPTSASTTYSFTFLQREIPHLRAKTKKEQRDKGWIDYVARTGSRPILGEIKWKGDKNPFYAFIQLLTYLSEIATPSQIERAIKHKLFGDGIASISTFDLHIFLGNFVERGDRVPMIELTRQLASEFTRRLRKDHPDVANCIGSVLCFSGHIEDGSGRFSSKPNGPKCFWMV